MNSITINMPMTFVVNETLTTPDFSINDAEIIKELQRCVKQRLDKCQRDLIANKEAIHKISDTSVFYLSGGTKPHAFSILVAEDMQNFVSSQTERDETLGHFLSRFDMRTIYQVIKAYIRYAIESEDAIISILFDRFEEAMGEE